MDWILLFALCILSTITLRALYKIKVLMLGIYALKQELLHLKADVNSVKMHVSRHTKDNEVHADILAMEEELKQKADEEFNKDFYSLKF